jgi:hypothetical protein
MELPFVHADRMVFLRRRGDSHFEDSDGTTLSFSVAHEAAPTTAAFTGRGGGPGFRGGAKPARGRGGAAPPRGRGGYSDSEVSTSESRILLGM